MTVFRNERQWDASNAKLRNSRILAYHKVTRAVAMRYNDYGLGVFQRRDFEVVPAVGTSDQASVYQEMLRRRELAGFEVTERFYEIGSAPGLEETRGHLSGLA
jgi:N-acetyl-alpha-D-muramate 1-phosphate uridylyltransferase